METLIPTDIKDFESGYFKQESGYKSFLPSLINKEWIISDPTVNTLLEEANRKLGELNAFSSWVPDINLFILMHITKEATSSSRIEGTQTGIEEVILNEEDIDPNRRGDWQEVQNYIRALNMSIKKLNVLPLSTRLLKMTHKVLLQGVRGEKRQPGEFRRSQNWIGGTTLKDAIFIPPNHLEIPQLMSDLEKFIHNDQINIPHLIRVAISHYQFETIHPFLDGNGRLGRLLITLYLVSQKLLEVPSLYISDFFEKNKGYYYTNLNIVRTNNVLTQWIKFFLVAVVETSKNGIHTFKEILKLRDDIENERITTLGMRMSNARKLVEYLYSRPVFRPVEITKVLHITQPTVNRLINDLVKLNILKEKTGNKRNRIFYFEPYLDLFRT